MKVIYPLFAIILLAGLCSCSCDKDGDDDDDDGLVVGTGQLDVTAPTLPSFELLAYDVDEKTWEIAAASVSAEEADFKEYRYTFDDDLTLDCSTGEVFADSSLMAAGGKLQMIACDLTGNASEIALLTVPRIFGIETTGSLTDSKLGAIAPSGGFAAFLDDPEATGVFELYALNSPVAAPAKVSGTLVADGSVESFLIGADTNQIYYKADQEFDNVNDLWLAHADGSDAPRQLSGPMVSGGDAKSYKTTTDGTKIVYTADQETDTAVELWVVSADGSGAPVKLSGSMVTGGAVKSFRISADDTKVVFTADRETDEVTELWSVNIDASNTPQKLSGVMNTDGNGGDIVNDNSFTIGPNGVKVIYLADQETNNVDELWSANIDGSGDAQKLNGPLVVGGICSSYLVDPTGARVVYAADQQADDVDELWSANIDGSDTPQKLNGALVSGGDMTAYQISPDGLWVLYQADQETDEVFELYSVKIDSSAVPQKLNGELVLDGDVLSGPIITSDSSKVIYRADQETDLVNEIYVVSIDGTVGALKLNGVLVSGGGVSSFKTTPDGSEVVYLADQEVDEVFELYAVNTDGTPVQQKLSGSMASGGSVEFELYQISPDGALVVYVADQNVDGEIDAFISTIDGSKNFQINDAPSITGGVPCIGLDTDEEGKGLLYYYYDAL